MDFQQLLAKMVELDRPVGETVVPECGEPMGMNSPTGMTPPGMPSKPDVPPPSMSVNLNAQGLDNIEQLMKLVTKVNPDMEKPAMPPMAAAPAIEIEPVGKPAGLPPLGGLGDLDKGPLKMLPDLDADNDDMPGGEKDSPDADIDGVDLGKDDGVSKAQGDIDGDGDHDMDDHKAEKDDENEATDNRDAYQRDFDASQTGFGKPDREDDEGEDESFSNSVGNSEPEVDNIDSVLPGGDDLNKPKKSFSGKPYRGDNPMAANAYESTDLRAQIRAELLQRLAEAKGAK